MKTVQIPIKNITTKFYVRTGINQDRIQFFKDLYESDEPVDPIEVARITNAVVGGEDYYELIEGRHRVEAAKEAGFGSISAKVGEYDNDRAKVFSAVLANVGGPLPPTLADYEHSIELLINLKVSKKDILENFPTPRSITAKFYKLTLGKIYKRTVRKGVDAVIRGDMTVKAAAETYKVALDDLRRALNRKSEPGTGSVDDILVGFEHSVRSMSQSISKKTQVVIELFEAGEIGRNDVARFIKRLKDSSEKISHTAKTSRSRLESALTETEKTLVVLTTSDQEVTAP